MLTERTKIKRTNLIIVALVLIILILIIIILYSFVIKPSINGYLVKKQVEAKDAVLKTILLQIQQQGFTQISDSQTSIYLIPISQEDLQTLLTNQQAQRNQQAIQQKQEMLAN